MTPEEYLETIPDRIVYSEESYRPVLIEFAHHCLGENAEILNQSSIGLGFISNVKYIDSTRMECRSWVVGGDIPFMCFDSDKITNWQEALALWVYFLRDWRWSHKKSQLHDLPELFMPPDWGPAVYSLDFITWISKREFYLQWKVLAVHKQSIVSPEIRSYCISLGIAMQ